MSSNPASDTRESANLSEIVSVENMVRGDAVLTRGQRLKQRLRAGEAVLSAWLSFSNVATAEIMAGTGFDCLIIDTEHGPFSLEGLLGVLAAFNGRDTAAIVRVPWNDPIPIKQMLDLGADGILVPQIRSASEAEQAVSYCKYPPEGTRGYGPRRASDYYRQEAVYQRAANGSVSVMLQIEHIDAVHCADQILAVPGIDAVLIGPMDLSGSLGRLGQLDHPDVQSAIRHVIAQARAAGVPVGVAKDGSIEAGKDLLAQGCQILTIGEDQQFLSQMALQTLERFRLLLREYAECATDRTVC
jgi:2-keto-3-deoxy-L-rhamnonate aldolase RhmA